jgi:hypothetical protein
MSATIQSRIFVFYLDHLLTPRCRGENNINCLGKKIRREGADCITLAQDRNKYGAFLNTAMNLQFP